MPINFRQQFDLILDHPQLRFLIEVAKTLPAAEWFMVGGAVRDVALGRVGKQHDFDLVVRGVSLDEVSVALGKMGKVSYVGRDFGVLKFWPKGSDHAGQAVDIAWPRIERAGGSGARRDFEVHSDPDLPIVDDLARRDFTINAMAWDFQQDLLLDPFGGLDDLEARLVRAVGRPDERFGEDMSRLLRAIRFACQLDFEIEQQTWEALLRRSEHLNDLHEMADGKTERVVPFEVIAAEFLKALAANPVRAIELFERSGLMFRIWPELGRLEGLDQHSEWHTEGDAWKHTKLAVRRVTGNEFAAMFAGESLDVETLVAILLHDIGKAETAVESNGRVSFHGHDARGAVLARAAVDRLRLSSVPDYTVRPERIEWLVRNHMFPILVDLEHVRKTTLCKYFLDDELRGRQLLHLSFADLSASLPEQGEPDLSNLDRLLDVIADLKTRCAEVDGVKLTGEDVMAETGLDAGPDIGRLLEELREAQLSGQALSDEEAKDLLRRKMGK